MIIYCNKLDDETIGILNGKSVITALASQKNKISEDELLEYFITSADEPDLVENELKQILNNGVAGGFIVKTGNKYALPSLENIYEADCDDESKDSNLSGMESKDSSLPGMELTISSPGRYIKLSYKKIDLLSFVKCVNSPDVTVKFEPKNILDVEPPEIR